MGSFEGEKEGGKDVIIISPAWIMMVLGICKEASVSFQAYI